MASSRPPSLTVQLVLFRHQYPLLLRTAQSLVASFIHARRSKLVTDIAVEIGDCSPEPTLKDDELESLKRIIEGVGALFGYEFFEANLGSAGGSNRLAENQETTLLFVLNPDTYVHPHAITELVRAAAVDVGAIDARQLPLEHPKSHDPISGDTSWASGAAMMLRREAFDQVGGFDTEHFFLHCDDVDLSWRLRIAGWRVVHAPKALVFHDKRVDAAGRIPAPDAERYHGLLGRLMLCRRYDRQDLIEATTKAVSESSDDVQLRALAEFKHRLESGSAPSPLPASEIDGIAQFVRGNYAEHRF